MVRMNVASWIPVHIPDIWVHAYARELVYNACVTHKMCTIALRWWTLYTNDSDGDGDDGDDDDDNVTSITGV